MNRNHKHFETLGHAYMIINMDATNYTNNSSYYNLHHSKGTIPKIVATHWLPIYGLMSQSGEY